MTQIKDSCILITGGASGIGFIMGRMALEKGARKLVIWDIDEIRMEKVRNDIGMPDKVATYKVDVSDSDAVKTTYDKTRVECDYIDILVNCAGVVTGNKTFDKQTVQDINRTISINTLAPMYLTLQALPDMIARDKGHVCNIASAAGMISNPRMSVYVASKWAVIGWSDSIRIELKQRHSHVRITTIAPYYINTGMFNGVQSRIVPILHPESTAKKIIRAIECNKDFKGIPFTFHLTRFFQGLLPTSWFDTIIGKWAGIYSAMDNFTGHRGE